MQKLLLTTILILFMFTLFLPTGKVGAFSLVEGIEGTPCMERGDCTVCNILSVVYQVAKFIFISMSGIALILFLWAGIGLIFNYGSAEKVAESKKIILHTVLGLVIILLAWTLVNALIFVLAGKEPGADLDTTFWTTGNWWTGPKCN